MTLDNTRHFESVLSHRSNVPAVDQLQNLHNLLE
jgi:hypothetical protein